ncbi:SLATT domain-containing protein [Niabella sp. CC-SYL272]|uniref:SLATT domain-containing protein n=1 Tax=Niabella agricola TaxID=2891571 RepID=UPI001F324037|nr:SLATT domain-containing protein [Niabella agricola]MCF3110916.1 SLATT domain-containing protein [Niabella agricola]
MGEDIKTTSGQLYLDKDFSVELNYKFWTTKGARFVASHRLKKMNRLSSYSIGFLSGYLIIVGLLSVFKIETKVVITPDQLAFISTGLSILILVFSQLEGANDYRLRAEKHHDCALEIGDLYNKLRSLKTSSKTAEEVNKLSEQLSEEYSIVLKKYENHHFIDFLKFQTTKNDYFKLSKVDILFVNLRYYFSSIFLYHFLIIVPPILIYLMVK